LWLAAGWSRVRMMRARVGVGQIGVVANTVAGDHRVAVGVGVVDEEEAIGGVVGVEGYAE